MRKVEPTRRSRPRSNAAGLNARRDDHDRTLAALHRLEGATGAPRPRRSWHDHARAALIVLDQATADEQRNANEPDSLLSEILRNKPRLRPRVHGIHAQYSQIRTTVRITPRRIDLIRPGRARHHRSTPPHEHASPRRSATNDPASPTSSTRPTTTRSTPNSKPTPPPPPEPPRDDLHGNVAARAYPLYAHGRVPRESRERSWVVLVLCPRMLASTVRRADVTECVGS